MTQEEKIRWIDALQFLSSEGKVNLKKPQHIFSILEGYGLDPNHIPENPHNIYFGRWIADEHRELIESYSVKKRHFIWNTSMDAGLSFIMANHGKVKKKRYCIWSICWTRWPFDSFCSFWCIRIWDRRRLQYCSWLGWVVVLDSVTVFPL